MLAYERSRLPNTAISQLLRQVLQLLRLPSGDGASVKSINSHQVMEPQSKTMYVIRLWSLIPSGDEASAAAAAAPAVRFCLTVFTN